MQISAIFVLLAGTAAALAEPVCYPRGKCHKGYMDKTKGGGNYWACGRKCNNGRMFFVDSHCNCACIKADQCSEDGSIKQVHHKGDPLCYP